MEPSPHSDEHINARAKVLDAHQTPRQQELARRIHEQLTAGAEVADVQDLIAEMSQAMAERAREV